MRTFFEVEQDSVIIKFVPDDNILMINSLKMLKKVFLFQILLIFSHAKMHIITFYYQLTLLHLLLSKTIATLSSLYL